MRDPGGPISFRRVQRDDIRPLVALSIRPEQAGLVSANAVTLAEIPYEPGAHVCGIWMDETAVGLIAMIDPSHYPATQEVAIDRNTAYVWRLMIADTFQGQGIGSAAMAHARETAARWGYDAITLTVVDQTGSAFAFYQRFGFAPTGRILYGDEREMICKLGP